MAAKAYSTEALLALPGTQFEPGEWFEIDQSRINDFADCTLDHQFIHIDEEAAKATPFGGTIAHGFLTLSMLVKLCENSSVVHENTVMAVNDGFDKIRFLTPVRAGKRVRAHVGVASVDQKDANRFLVKTNVSVEIEGEDNPALVAEWLSMLFIA